MKKLVKLVVGLLFFPALAIAGNYTVTINNTPHDFSLGEEKTVSVDGQNLTITLVQKDIVEFARDNYSFKHSSKFNPSTTQLDEGITQTAMMTSLGTVVIVQEYTTINPAGMISLMINEVTKEERQYGYDINSSPTSVTLQDGTVLTGQIVTSKYPGTDIKRYVLAYGAKDRGLLVMTQIDYSLASAEESVIKTFLDTLNIKM
jgi:hypothetical protein